MKYVFLIFFSLLCLQTMDGQNLPLLEISSDSSYLVTGEDEPFFWLGGTAWELIHRLDKDEVDHYLTDRASKGFTVIQTVILAELDGLNTPNAYGDRPLISNDPTKLNERYFQHVDYVLEKAGELGLYIALLPTWGDKVNKKWGVGPEIFNPANAQTYGQILAKRYQHHTNLIWILGGDRPLETETHLAIIRAMAKGIRDVDKDHLISFHPVGASKATDYLTDEWLDVDMYQSGHSRTAQEYTYVPNKSKASTKRPIINGEARYENIPDRFWEEDALGWLDDADVRVSAYWSIIAGAAGYTYGCNDIWQMYDISKTPVISARTDWQSALQLPGSSHVGYMRKIFEKLLWQEMVPNQDLLLNSNPAGESYAVSAISSDNRIIVAYTPTGAPLEIELSMMDAENIDAYWFNPRSGKIKHVGVFEKTDHQEFKPWSSGWGSDYLLVLLAENHDIELSELKK